MHFSNRSAKQSWVTLLVIASALMSGMMSGCVKPQNHDSKIDDSASFYVSDVKASLATNDLIDGYSIPRSRLYTMTACLKDRRTDEALPGLPFEISGGSGSREIDQEFSTDKNGCAIWREKIAFDFLAQEIYLPMKRTLTLKGLQSGSRVMNLAVNPWTRNESAPAFVDLDHSSVPAKQLSVSETTSPQPRRLYIASLPIKNSAAEGAGATVSRNIKVYLDPSISMTDINGNSVNVAITVKAGNLKVSATLIESVTDGGLETKTITSKVTDAAVKFEDGKLSATLPLEIRRGTSASRYVLALVVKPVDGPKNLLNFEGIFSLGDLKSLTESGASTAELKTSNADSAFTVESYLSGVGTAAASSPSASRDVRTSKFTGNTGRGPTVPQNSGAGDEIKAFRISRIEPTWSGVAGGVDVTNQRTIMYRVRACVTDTTNGGRPASGVEFSITLANKTVIKRATTSLNGLDGCLEWEDKITHRYYEPERFYVIPVTFKHRSGFTETRTYAIDPWQAFRFSADAAAQPEMIDAVNGRAKAQSRILADGIEFNTQSTLRYDVDEFLGLNIIKKVLLRVPLRVMRPSSITDGLGSPTEPLRQGRYLLKAAFVAPLLGVAQKKSELVVSPMIGLNRIVDVRGGELKVAVEFPVSDVRLMNARSYIAFELYLIDETKLPANNPYLLNSNIDPMTLVDRTSNLITPTFVGALNMKSEKDSAILITAADMGLAVPLTDRINGIASVSNAQVLQTSEPLANITVDRLYALAQKDRQEYVGRMSIQKSLGLLAVRANADVIFVNNEAANTAGDKLLRSNNKILGPADRALKPLLANLNARLELVGSSSVASLNSKGALRVTPDVLSKLIRGQQPFDARLAAQFCGYFFEAVVRTKVSGLSLAYVQYGNPGSWMDLCIDEVKAHGPDYVFSVDHRIRVLKTAGAQWVRGRSLDITTGANIGFSQTHSASWGWGMGFGTSGAFGELSKRALLGQGNKALKIFTAAVGVSGIGADMTRTNSNSTSISGGFGFDIGQRLSVEQNELRIKVTASDECVVVRPRPLMFEGLRSNIHMKLLKQRIGENEADQLMGRGLMICNGVVDKIVRDVPERYYSFGFQLSGGNVTDPRNLNNLPWLMSLRGQRDYASFLMLASGQKTSVSEAKTVEMDLGDLPNSRLQTVYDQIFAGRMATIPGFITAEPKILFRRVN